jgi:proteic killer suppression protein
MMIRSVRHRGLRLLIEHDDERGIRPDLRRRVRHVVAALVAAADMNGIEGMPGWRVHWRSGARAGTWSVSASGNWRTTFEVQDDEICNLDLEGYHR